MAGSPFAGASCARAGVCARAPPASYVEGRHGEPSGAPYQAGTFCLRIVPQVPGCIRAGGPTSAPVGVVLARMGPCLGGGVGPVTAGAVIPPGRGMVATSSGGSGATGGTPLRLWLTIPLHDAVGPSISCTVASAAIIIVEAPVAPFRSPPGERGSAVGRFRGSLRRLGKRRGTAVQSGSGRTRRHCLRRRRRHADHLSNRASLA